MNARALARACPGCAEPMEARNFGRKPQGDVDVDICFRCHALWFDRLESAQLTPGGVLALFKAIVEHHGPARPIAGNPRCPICRVVLKPTQDFHRTNRLSYFRCPNGDGRLTTFFQFLREKEFVRDLRPFEIDQLRATVRQVRCSSCGASVDLVHDAVCAYCRSPVAILDADAMRRTLEALNERERERLKAPDPQAAIEALLAGQEIGRKLARQRPKAGIDLVQALLVSVVGGKSG